MKAAGTYDIKFEAGKLGNQTVRATANAETTALASLGGMLVILWRVLVLFITKQFCCLLQNCTFKQKTVIAFLRSTWVCYNMCYHFSVLHFSNYGTYF